MFEKSIKRENNKGNKSYHSSIKKIINHIPKKVDLRLLPAHLHAKLPEKKTRDTSIKAWLVSSQF